MKVLTVVGARPQFIKAAAVSREFTRLGGRGVEEVLVHTGQHYDENMSRVFFDELDIPPPKYNLEIAGGSHGAMTGRMLEAMDRLLDTERPDWVLVYGDTNSTLAGALSAAKLHVPVAHVEAGLRSFNMRMPEEVNRILTDRVSSLLFCPTSAAIKNLAAEGLTKGVHDVGDVMFDVALYYRRRAGVKSDVLTRLALRAGEFVLATCHRAENTNDSGRLRGILTALDGIAVRLPVVFPLHPRTRQIIAQCGLQGLLRRLCCVDPLPYLDMIVLEQAARAVLTDSGGVQKEAFFFGVPCITLREETEWVELVDLGWNQLAGADPDRIVNAFENAAPGQLGKSPYGDGSSARAVVSLLMQPS